ncbi:MAG: hypothetical protein HN611_02255 [Gemmatimonadetes bacterium]|jgi:flagellar motor switch protein FliM|nr:hypothetical protein [Gemmatimonadota bacterium]
MADILSQQEIDALLSANDGDMPSLADRLAKYGVDNKRIATLFREINGLGMSDLEADACEKSALAALDAAIEGKGVSKRQRTGLRTIVKGRIAEQADKKRQVEENKAREARKTMVMSYDFKHPARVNRDQLRMLENLHDNFARLLSSTLSETFQAVVDVDTAFVDQTTYAEFIMSLSNPALSYQFTLGPTNGQAILDISMPVTFATIDRSFGGKGSSQGVEARQVTPIEIGEMNTLVKKMIEDLEATWEPILKVEITDVELETNPEFMQVTVASEIVILLAFEVNSTNASGLISLCYPFFTLESILPRLGQQSYVRSKRLNQAELLRQNRLRMGGMELPVKAELGTGQISVADARKLKVGDVMTLETLVDEPAVVYLAEEPKYLAYPCVSKHGHNSVKVAGAIPATEETKYRNRSKPLAD